MEKITLAAALFALILVLYFVSTRLETKIKDGFSNYISIGINKRCSNKQVKFVHGNRAFCFDIGDHPNTSGLWSTKEYCKVSAPTGIKLQAYYNTDFSTPTWTVNPGATWNGNCWPYSLKVFKV